MSNAGADLFEAVHSSTGLPYWSIIVGSTIALRLGLLPLMVQSIKMSLKMEKIKPHLDKLQEELRMSGGYKNIEAQRTFQTGWDKIRKEHGFSMMKQFAPVLAQMPMFIFFFTSIRSVLAYNAGAKTGGCLWFEDLTIIDPFLRLNLLTAGVMYLSFKLGGSTNLLFFF
jgi:YidC/Oxa1 family membrane protein insertase